MNEQYYKIFQNRATDTIRKARIDYYASKFNEFRRNMKKYWELIIIGAVVL